MPRTDNEYNVSDRLIVALDVPDADAALNLIKQCGTAVTFYKIGLELYSSGHAFKIIEALKKADKRIFLDLKLHDIPETVRRAVKAINNLGVDLLTIHAEASVIKGATTDKHDTNLLAVSALTSISQQDLQATGVNITMQEYVNRRAQLANDYGCYGLVTSGHEARQLKNNFPSLKLVVPGIRIDSANKDDQKRTNTPNEAINNGADFIVVGRPIRDAASPKEVAQFIQMLIMEEVNSLQT